MAVAFHLTILNTKSDHAAGGAIFSMVSGSGPFMHHNRNLLS
jgi:hypothetical protein